MSVGTQQHPNREGWSHNVEAAQEAVDSSRGFPNRVYSYLSRDSQNSGSMLGLRPPAIDLATLWVPIEAQETASLTVAAAARRLCAAKEVGFRIVDVVYGRKQIFPPQFELVSRTEPTDEPVDLRPLAEVDPAAIGLVVKRNSRDIGVALLHGSLSGASPDIPTILPLTHEWFITHPAQREDVATVVGFVQAGVVAQVS